MHMYNIIVEVKQTENKWREQTFQNKAYFILNVTDIELLKDIISSTKYLMLRAKQFFLSKKKR